MRKILVIVAIAVFLYSPYGPEWGRLAVNGAIVLAIFSFFSRHVPKRSYYDEHED